MLQSDRCRERIFLSLNQLLSWVSGVSVVWLEMSVLASLLHLASLKGYNQVWYQPIPQSQFVMSQTKDHFLPAGTRWGGGTVHDDYISHFLKKMSHKASPAEILLKYPCLGRAWHPPLYCLEKLFQKIKDLKVIQMYISRYILKVRFLDMINMNTLKRILHIFQLTYKYSNKFAACHFR